MRENLKELYASTGAIHCDIVLRRDLDVYLTYWLGEAILLEEMERTSGRTAFFRLVRWRLESGLLWRLLFTPICVPNYRQLLS